MDCEWGHGLVVDVPEVSVIIPARNVEAFLGEELAALAAQEFDRSWEVVVVDNASTDGTAQLAQSWSDALPGLRVVPCAGLGVNRARNVGVRAARASKLLFCDADDIVGPGWLRAMCDALDTTDVVGGSLLTAELNVGMPGLERIGGTKTRLLKTLDHLPYVAGGNMGFRRTVFDAVDGFDEAFSGGGDEVDFCWRAQYAGFSIAFVPGAVLHYRLRHELRAFARRCYSQRFATARLYAKHLELGRLPQQSAMRKLRVMGWHLFHLGRIDLLLHEATRWDYVRRLAGFAGAVKGYARYHVAV
jgi:glycosyltransferase involved in cell wall biosynthesis